MYRRLHVGARVVYENNLYELVGHDKAPDVFFLMLISPRECGYDARPYFGGFRPPPAAPPVLPPGKMNEPIPAALGFLIPPCALYQDA